MRYATGSATLLVLGLLACGGDGGTAGPSPAPNTLAVTISLNGNSQPVFNPTFGEVAVGGTVTWTIPTLAPEPHNITSNAGAWASSELDGGDTFSQMFAQAGEFPYRCTIHPTTMVGTITVR